MHRWIVPPVHIIVFVMICNFNTHFCCSASLREAASSPHSASSCSYEVPNRNWSCDSNDARTSANGASSCRAHHHPSGAEQPTITGRRTMTDNLHGQNWETYPAGTMTLSCGSVKHTDNLSAPISTPPPPASPHPPLTPPLPIPPPPCPPISTPMYSIII